MKSSRWVKRWEIPGSDGKVWIVAQDQKGIYGCSCPRWKFRREECHHIIKVKVSGGQEIQHRDARPGNVGEVCIDGDVVLYPLVPIPCTPDLPATIVYDLIRANVSSDQVKDYASRMLRGASIKQIVAHVEAKGRFIYSQFVEGRGWVSPVFVPYDEPLKTLREVIGNESDSRNPA